jgi:ribonuclease HII
MPIEPTITRELAAWDDACLLVGVDEVGRGPLAGPVVAAAVAFPRNFQPIPGVRDSKTLPAAQRDLLAITIRASALALGVGAASVREIDALNIRVATALAMRRALKRALPRLDACRILVDGVPFRELGYAHEALVDGDAHCFSIAAAGIVAKTVRDRVMHRLAARHPGYGWHTNVGYGTPEHQQGLQRLGPCVHHRRSFAPVAQLAFL